MDTEHNGCVSRVHVCGLVEEKFLISSYHGAVGNHSTREGSTECQGNLEKLEFISIWGQGKHKFMKAVEFWTD